MLNFVQNFVILYTDRIAALLALLICWPGPEEDRFRLPFKFDNDGADILIAREGKDNLATYYVEIGIEGVRIIKVDSNGHLEVRVVSR